MLGRCLRNAEQNQIWVYAAALLLGAVLGLALPALEIRRPRSYPQVSWYASRAC
jgi:hypothetical protein